MADFDALGLSKRWKFVFPMWIRVAPAPGAVVFAVLSMIEAASRALIAGVLPLEAHALLRDAQAISAVYTIVGVLALAASFLIPIMLRSLSRKWIFSFGVLCMVASPLLLSLHGSPTFIASLLIRGLAVVSVNIALNLYILDYIRKKEFVSSEPLRLAFLGIAWSIGPALGIWLYKEFGLLAVSLSAASLALVALLYFWYLRLIDNPAVQPNRGKPTAMPWQNIRRYLEQPRLRLAWIIPFGRSTYWVTFFVYPPLYILQSGGSEYLVAFMLTGGQALLLISPMFGKMGARFGLRPMIVGAACYTAVLSIATGFLQPSPMFAICIFILASVGATALDALGNIPFLRSVHFYERAEMTSVFRTYIEISSCCPPRSIHWFFCSPRCRRHSSCWEDSCWCRPGTEDISPKRM